MTWLPDSLCGNMKGRAICFPKYIEIYWQSYNLILMFECYLSLQVQTWNQTVMPWMLCQVGRIQFFSCLVAFLVLFFFKSYSPLVSGNLPSHPCFPLVWLSPPVTSGEHIQDSLRFPLPVASLSHPGPLLKALFLPLVQSDFWVFWYFLSFFVCPMRVSFC